MAYKEGVNKVFTYSIGVALAWVLCTGLAEVFELPLAPVYGALSLATVAYSAMFVNAQVLRHVKAGLAAEAHEKDPLLTYVYRAIAAFAALPPEEQQRAADAEICLRKLLTALSGEPGLAAIHVAGTPLPYVHNKSGRTYLLLGSATDATNNRTLPTVAVYTRKGHIYVRDYEEFLTNFTKSAHAAQPDGVQEPDTTQDYWASLVETFAKARAYDAINTPEIHEFLSAVEREALHQRERWGAVGDAGKSRPDWFWLVGYLAGKALSATHEDKRLHHIITTAAALLNWHAAETGRYTDMRPGIVPTDTDQ